MRILGGHDEVVAGFVADHAPIERPLFAPGFRAFGIINDGGALVGGVVFSDWRPKFSTVELSGVALDPRAFGTRNIVTALGSYPFGQLNVFRLWARTATANKRARRLLAGLGFKEEGVAAHHYGPNRHAVTLRVTRPEWIAKWGGVSPLAKVA